MLGFWPFIWPFPKSSWGAFGPVNPDAKHRATIAPRGFAQATYPSKAASIRTAYLGGDLEGRRDGKESQETRSAASGGARTRAVTSERVVAGTPWSAQVASRCAAATSPPNPPRHCPRGVNGYAWLTPVPPQVGPTDRAAGPGRRSPAGPGETPASLRTSPVAFDTIARRAISHRASSSWSAGIHRRYSRGVADADVAAERRRRR